MYGLLLTFLYTTIIMIVYCLITYIIYIFFIIQEVITQINLIEINVRICKLINKLKINFYI